MKGVNKQVTSLTGNPPEGLVHLQGLVLHSSHFQPVITENLHQVAATREKKKPHKPDSPSWRWTPGWQRVRPLNRRWWTGSEANKRVRDGPFTTEGLTSH